MPQVAREKNYPLSKRSKATPKPILSVLNEDLGYRTNFVESIAGGCQVGDFYRVTSDGTIISKDLHLGYLSRVRLMAQEGIKGGELVPPFYVGSPEQSLSAPSGWQGWVRQLAYVSHITGRPMFDKAHEKFVDERPECLLEALRAMGVKAPEWVGE